MVLSLYPQEGYTGNIMELSTVIKSLNTEYFRILTRGTITRVYEIHSLEDTASKFPYAIAKDELPAKATQKQIIRNHNRLVEQYTLKAY